MKGAASTGLPVREVPTAGRIVATPVLIGFITTTAGSWMARQMARPWPDERCTHHTEPAQALKARCEFQSADQDLRSPPIAMLPVWPFPRVCKNADAAPGEQDGVLRLYTGDGRIP